MSFLKDLNPNIRNTQANSDEQTEGSKPTDQTTQATSKPKPVEVKPAANQASNQADAPSPEATPAQPQNRFMHSTLGHAANAGAGEQPAENPDQPAASMGPAVSPADLKAAYDVKNPDQREYQSLAEARDGIAQELGEEKAAPFGEYQRRIKGFIEEHDNARAGIKAKGKQVQLNFRISENSRHYLKLVALENHVDVTTYVFGAINARLHAEGRTRYVR